MTPLDAAFWAFISAIPLFVGTLITRYLGLDKKIVVIIMAFGSGALISVVTFSLMREAYHLGGGSSNFSWIFYRCCNFHSHKSQVRNRQNSKKES